MSENIRTKVVFTRKEHLCFLCVRKFPKGTKMNTWTCTGDDGIYTLHSCSTCEEIIKKEPSDDRWYEEGHVSEMINGYGQERQTPEDYLRNLREKECLHYEQTK